MRRTYRRRRRGVYIPVLPLLLLAAACAALAWFFVRPRDERPAPDPTPPQAETDAPPDAQAVTASGIACTWTELGEEALYTGDLILVNNQILYHFPQEQPLASIYEEKTGSYYVRDMEVYLAPAALEALNRMMDDFMAQGGSKSVNVVAGYRTEEFQQHLFDQSAQRNGEEHARKYVAQPGGSEHHTGLVVDLSILHADGSSEEYRGQGEYAWINENCQDYGWVVRYDAAKESLTGIADEPWHFRYVGVAHASVMAEQGLCLEEYTDYLRQFTFDGEHLTVTCAGGTYEIWYTAGTAAYLPDGGTFSVSGNNVDGVIVTCKTG